MDMCLHIYVKSNRCLSYMWFTCIELFLMYVSSSIHVHVLLLISVGMFYYQVGNLSPEYRSSIKSIHLVAIARSSVIWCK